MPRFQEPSIEENVFTPIATQRWPRKLVLMLCGLLLSLAILEMGARTYAWLTSQERTVIADDLLGWKLVPRAKHLYRKEEQAYLIAINSKGLRDTEHSYDKPTGVFRIVVVGDSFVFGSGGVETSERFTDILEKSTKNIEVINMGVPAYGSDQEYLYLKTEGLKYRPDLIILCAFENDFRESFSTVNPSNGRPKGYFSASGGQLVFHPPSFSLFYRLAQRSYIFGFTDLALTKLSKPTAVCRVCLGPRTELKLSGSCLSKHERCVFNTGRNWYSSIFLFAARRIRTSFSRFSMSWRPRRELECST